MTRNRLTRSGFTLVEMMVAMALSLGIMLILTESFKMALDFVRGANSTGEMISQLNGAGILMTRDLQADHFLDAKSATSGPKLADQRLDVAGWTPSTGGFFRISAPAVGIEQTDPQGFNINLPSTGHQLHFTSILLNGGPIAGSFTANSGGNQYSSQAAEIAYFLAPMGKKTSVTAGGQDLYNLIRRQRLVALNSGEVSSLAPAAGDSDVISVTGANVNTMASLVPLTLAPAPNRMTLAPFATTNTARYGEDIVVSNVLSFEVLADWTATAAANYPRAFTAGNTDAPYDFLNGVAAYPGGIFDTGITPPPMPVRIKSLQVTIRIYDPRLKAARQNTWKFAM
ncbi:MAG: prepilin-type N-terminal cleavage/methylation domain-containing protein [Planctomycetes bacterium]|nr:prepilin-type N-terminal cleavage/methylation domain-containing protein [Planctomycetota bacterium]